eukprot:TRINITY_DN33205_c1_g2_i3.p1 TRINITY_DN33205_c1_g2~~TRINITY_DN33205_c1_g2_i3.p1  ORF type:complete len:281 (+),score=43.74 TRINITY_DN33205_c1_g2_i3:371-1213(+)
MKMLISSVVLLCVAGAINGQAVGEACGASSACGTDLVCDTVDTKCRKKIGAACDDAASTDCFTNAGCKDDSGFKCTCDAGRVASSDNTKCPIKIGVDCTNKVDQCVTGATCQDSDKKCTCPAMTTPNGDNDKCLMYVGGACENAVDCADNAVSTECPAKKCACKTNYLALFDNSKCKLAPGQTCVKDAPTCGAYAECPDSLKCTCKTGFDAKAGERCGKKIDVACGGPSECVPNAECKTDKCACKADYVDDGDKFCKSSATSAVASVLLMVAAFLSSRWM